MAVDVREIMEKLGGCQDFVKREIVFREHFRSAVTILFLETMCDVDHVSHYVVEPLASLRRNVSSRREVGRAIHSASIREETDTESAVEHILAGNAVVVFEPLDYAVYVESRKVKTRAIEKSQFEPTLFGPYEGFNELITDNISLIRKRMNTEDLMVERYTVGLRSRTSAALLYVKGTAPGDLVKYVREKLETINSDFVVNVESVSERLNQAKTLFDVINYTEKPETVVAALFEGRIAVLVNGCPYALTAPYFFFEMLHSFDDYASNRVFVTAIRTVRYLALIVSLFLPGLYVALSTHHYTLIPTAFVFKLAVSRAGVPFPTVIEVLILQLFFEFSREAGRRMPQQIGQALSIVGGLILGDAAVGAGLASQVTVVVIGVYAIASLINVRATPWLTIWTTVMILLSAAFGLHGFYLGFFLIVANLASIRSCNYPFLFPFGTARSFKTASRDILRRAALSKISKPFIYGGKNDGRKG